MTLSSVAKLMAPKKSTLFKAILKFCTTKKLFTIFILFLDNFIVTLKARFSAHKSIIGEFQCLISADQTSAPTPQQIKSIQVLEKFYENDLTKSWGELVPELILCYRKLFRLNAAERPTDALSSIKECTSDAVPNIFTLMTILLTLPVITCTCEQL